MFLGVANASLLTKVEMLAPILNKLIEDFESGSLKDGTEAFNNQAYALIDDCGLMEKGKIFQVGRVGVHPDNREKAMLVGIDVQSLLTRFSCDGWNWAKWQAFACKIPVGPIGDEWRQKNLELSRASDGLLAICDIDELEILTGRGSHGTAALRCAKFGAKATNPKLANEDGNISVAKLTELQPSLAEPLSKGCPYDVVPAELVLACPRLMEVLSRAGNAGNNVYREVTVLQQCNRLHALVSSNPQASENDIVRQACIGVGAEFAEDAKKLLGFVKAWSGGLGGTILQSLEAYERTLVVKRKIYASDLASLAALDLFAAPKYVPAMVKAILNAPTANETGHGIMFTSSDYTSLQANGKSVEYAINANKAMDQCEQFLCAYGRMPAHTRGKLLSEHEVRCVMIVHNKKFDTRKSFENFIDASAHLYKEAKVLDPNLPVWKLLVDASTTDAPQVNTLRELRMDGTIVDEILIARGFNVKVKVYDQADAEQIWYIKALNQNLTTVTMVQFDKDGLEINVFELARSVLLSKWNVHVDVQDEFYLDHPCPTQHLDILSVTWKGAITSALVGEWHKSAEQSCKLQTAPNQNVIATRTFNKAGTFKLVPLPSAVTLSKNVTTSGPGLNIGKVFTHDATEYYAHIKGVMVLPKKVVVRAIARTIVEPFVVKFWACDSSFEVDKVNCQHVDQDVTIKMGGESHVLSVPMVVNIKPIKIGDAIIVMKKSTAPVVPPPPKRQKVDEAGAEAKAPQNCAKGSGKKGKTKAKGKGK